MGRPGNRTPDCLWPMKFTLFIPSQHGALVRAASGANRLPPGRRRHYPAYRSSSSNIASSGCRRTFSVRPFQHRQLLDSPARLHCCQRFSIQERANGSRAALGLGRAAISGLRSVRCSVIRSSSVRLRASISHRRLPSYEGEAFAKEEVRSSIRADSTARLGSAASGAPRRA